MATLDFVWWFTRGSAISALGGSSRGSVPAGIRDWSAKWEQAGCVQHFDF